MDKETPKEEDNTSAEVIGNDTDDHRLPPLVSYEIFSYHGDKPKCKDNS